MGTADVVGKLFEYDLNSDSKWTCCLCAWVKWRLAPACYQIRFALQASRGICVGTTGISRRSVSFGLERETRE